MDNKMSSIPLLHQAGKQQQHTPGHRLGKYFAVRLIEALHDSSLTSWL